MVSWSVEWYVVVFFPQHTMVDAGVFLRHQQVVLVDESANFQHWVAIKIKNVN
jgi:hypothetical protein